MTTTSEINAANPNDIKLQTGKTELEWVWEIHKNADSLLHSRLSSFTAAQSLTLTAFGVLALARNGAQAGNGAISHNLLFGQGVVAVFGMLMATFGWLVTYPLYRRLRYLSINYLSQLPVYNEYYNRYVFKIHRLVIPVLLPVSEFVIWMLLLGSVLLQAFKQP